MQSNATQRFLTLIDLRNCWDQNVEKHGFNFFCVFIEANTRVLVLSRSWENKFQTSRVFFFCWFITNSKSKDWLWLTIPLSPCWNFYHVMTNGGSWWWWSCTSFLSLHGLNGLGFGVLCTTTTIHNLKFQPNWGDSLP